MTAHPKRNYKRYKDVTRVCGIQSGEFGKHTEQDVYFPKFSDKPLPVIVNVHGGGFVAGDKKYRSGIARFFASKGWVVVNTNYRLPPKGSYPDATTDTLTAMNFLPSLKERFKAQFDMDLSRIVISGDSAGGFYAAQALAATLNESLRTRLNLPEYTGQKPIAFLSFCTPFDLLKCLSLPVPLGMTADIGRLMFKLPLRADGKLNFDEFEYIDTVSVLPYLTPDFPETFMVAAVQDPICGGQIESAKEAFAAQNITFGVYVADKNKDGHCSHLIPYREGTPPCLKEVVAFLDRIKTANN
ncbi:MAG: alpha/beta hydrolase [Christensenellaceae bacterium]|nr:alpha/beta hydrolase [Christensenellaceae bacterium]